MLKKILVIEDDVEMQNYLKEYLKEHDFYVKTAGTATVALQLFSKSEPDLVVLDLGLPDMSGEFLCSELRKKNPQLPIIILTARDTPRDIVKGLNLGADDYVAKPFNADELLARIKARLRKNEGGGTYIITDLELNSETLEVKRGHKPIKLTPQEFRLLEYLMNNKGRVLSRDMILNRLWLSSSDVDTRVVDVYIGYLRKKIDKGFRKKLIHSIRGFGYTIKD
ncbi:response regulator transcription factor [Candidatus Roizmanbacteria bacterium]|nr:response regulator transcription factor [Candidatus Roizmanbacteria bacterium]